jgi:CRP-like cAMP-binding protein
VPLKELPAETVLLREGECTGLFYVLSRGTVSVLRGGTEVALVNQPGSLFGEMSVLLARPHTATVRAVTPVDVFVIDDAERFLRSHSELAFLLAQMLAERLAAATTYLVDLKQQYEDHGDHLSMVGEVLEALMNQQREDFMLGSDREPDRSL